MIAKGNTVLTHNTLGLAFAWTHRLAERPKEPTMTPSVTPERLKKRQFQRVWYVKRYHARLARQECPRCGRALPDATRRHCDVCRAKAKGWPSRHAKAA